MRRTISVPIVATIAVAMTLVGYFAGREHVKYEMRSALVDAGEAFREGMKDVFSGKTATAISTTDEERSDLEAFKQKPALPIGKFHDAKQFSIALINARIAAVEFKSSYDDGTYESDDTYLLFKFRVKNTDDRKILNYRKGGSFRSDYFSLTDDVGNSIRGVGFGFSNEPIGILSVIDDIHPGEERTHLAVFKIPPAKTKHLILTVDLKAFSEDGRVKFMVPVQQLDGFAVATP